MSLSDTPESMRGDAWISLKLEELVQRASSDGLEDLNLSPRLIAYLKALAKDY